MDLSEKTPTLPVFYSYLTRICLCLTVLVFCSCGEKPITADHVAQREKNDAESDIAPVQVRICQVEQSDFNDGTYQQFGLYIDNNTPDTLCQLEGRLVYCGQSGDTLAFIDFRKSENCSNDVVLITTRDTFSNQELFHLNPKEETLETISFSLGASDQLDPALRSMPDRFSCLWFPKEN